MHKHPIEARLGRIGIQDDGRDLCEFLGGTIICEKFGKLGRFGSLVRVSEFVRGDFEDTCSTFGTDTMSGVGSLLGHSEGELRENGEISPRS